MDKSQPVVVVEPDQSGVEIKAICADGHEVVVSFSYEHPENFAVYVNERQVYPYG